MRSTLRVLTALALLAAADAAHAQTPPVVQPQDAWVQAINEETAAAPRYVAATVIDSRNGASRNGCMLARELVGAMAAELGASRPEAKAQLLKSEDHVVRLSKPEALESLKAMSTPADAEMLVQDFTITSRDKIIEQQSGGWLPDQGPNLPAFACILIRYGFSPRLEGGSTVMF